MNTQEQLPRPIIQRWANIREALGTIFMMVAVFTLVELATPRFYVDGRSMQPNFSDGQRLIVSRVNYMFVEPDRGDIVVLKAPGQPDSASPLIKRIIGLPGETIMIHDAHVFIDGIELNEPYINEPCTEYHCTEEIWELGPDEFFVMGDNRNHSNDSRSFGPVPRERIIGEALIRYWPPPDWGVVAQIGFPNN